MTQAKKKSGSGEDVERCEGMTMKPTYAVLRILQKMSEARIGLCIHDGDCYPEWGPGGGLITRDEMDKLIVELRAHRADMARFMAPDGTDHGSAVYEEADIEKLVAFWAQNALAPWWPERKSRPPKPSYPPEFDEF